jgi:hypothetical protein
VEEKALAVQKQARYLAAALRAAQESRQEENAEQIPLDTIISRNQDTFPQSEESTDT